MLKKLAITGAAVAALFGSAAGAFASEPFQFPWFTDSANVTISNSGSVSNTVTTKANTGYNSQSVTGKGAELNTSSITTGAASAGSNVMTQLNWNQFDCGCVLGLSDVDELNFSLTNTGTVSNSVYTKANTGGNSQSVTGLNGGGGPWWFLNHDHSASIEGGSITTGAAAASSVIQNVVNTNMFGDSE